MRYSNEGRNPGMGNLFMNNNRNKRSLVLNLKHESGRAALLKLIARSDVLVSNVRPQAMARLGLAYEDVQPLNPGLIYVASFGFGQSGPYAERAAYDDLIQAMTGVPNLFERAYGDEPKFLPSNICDRITGLNVVNAVTAALFYRERTGVGQSIEVPMFETMAQFLLSDHLGLLYLRAAKWTAGLYTGHQSQQAAIIAPKTAILPCWSTTINSGASS